MAPRLMESVPDFGRTAGDYSRHRAGFPESIYARLLEYGVGVAGQRIVDLGTGTGTLARGFAGRGCPVIGIDPSPAMLDEARRLDRECGVTVEYRQSRAEDTGLERAAHDVVVAGQCWHWFDRAAAAREALRILRPGGHIVIAHFDWIPLAHNMVAATEALIAERNPKWKGAGGQGVYPWWFRDLGEAGFVELESFSYDETVRYTHEDWRGRVRASAGVGASLEPTAVEAFDRDLAELLRSQFPADPLEVPHRTFAIIGRSPD